MPSSSFLPNSSSYITLHGRRYSFAGTMEVEVRIIDAWTTRKAEEAPCCNTVRPMDSVEDPDVSFHSTRNVLSVHRSRVLWLGLVPLLFEAPMAVYAVQCILDHCFSYGLHRFPKNDPSDTKQQKDQRREAWAGNCIVSWTRSRRFRFQKRLQRCASSVMLKSLPQDDGSKVVLWIYPPQTMNLEYDWTRRLLHWERMYIQAQSITGYIATLGGGFFLCHHFQTAIVLARYQQQLAFLLNDMVMYYTCFVNMAYSYIYNGNFRVARSILHQVLNELVTTKMDSKVEVVVRMCQSALLFCRRMRRASRSISSSSTLTTLVELDANRQRQIVPMDNLRRIRVVTDKSKRDDLVVPFSKTVRSA